jgi:colicin import membrane protein
MKVGFSTSLVMHAALIAFGLVTLAAPPAHDVGDVQAVPVEMIPLESLTQLQQGDLKAEKSETPAPKPTARPDRVADARNVGDNAVDLDDVPKPAASPRKIDTAAAPKPEPTPKPEPKPVEAKPVPKVAEAKPEPKPVEPKPVEAKPVEAKPVEARPEPAPQPKPTPVEAKPEPVPAPTPSVVQAPAPEPTPKPTSDPVAETIASNDAPTETMQFPDQLPRPESRPTPPRQEVAKAEQAKKVEKPAETKSAQSQDLDAILDQAKALVSKEKPAGGGAKRSEQTASLGTDRPSTAQKLSASEMDALRQRLASCWSIPAGVDDASLLKVSVKFRLDRTGELQARPEVIRGGATSGPGRTAAESAVRAVSKCAPFNLPADKYETWAEVVVNFDPSDMF